MFERRLISGLLLLSLAFAGSVGAQSVDSTPESRWNGHWLAEGTLFQIRVTVDEGVITVADVESLGFVWNSEPGEVTGNIARIPVSYAGVNGIVEAELVNATTAVAVAASCLPDFMVVCALARNQQAVFRKVSEAAE